MRHGMKIELTKQELNLIIIGMAGCMYPMNLQKDAFDLVMKLRDIKEIAMTINLLGKDEK
jgi:hypothetical protein